MTFENDIRSAYENGILLDRIQIQQALQYENLVGTKTVAAGLHNKLLAHPEWPGLDSRDAAPGSGKSGNPPLFVDIREDIAPSKLPRHQVSHIKPARWLIAGDARANVPDVLDAIAKLGAEDAARSERRKRGRRLWESCFATDRLIWISQLPELPSTNLAEVLQGLGLYHLEHRMANEPFVQFVFKTSECFKPTWVDAALAFYFDAAPGAPESGLTRNLANGVSGYREWVTRKVGLKLVDVRVWRLDKSTAFHKPPAAFWSSHANRIKAMR